MTKLEELVETKLDRFALDALVETELDRFALDARVFFFDNYPDAEDREMIFDNGFRSGFRKFREIFSRFCRELGSAPVMPKDEDWKDESGL